MPELKFNLNSYNLLKSRLMNNVGNPKILKLKYKQTENYNYNRIPTQTALWDMSFASGEKTCTSIMCYSLVLLKINLRSSKCTQL